VAEQNVQKTHYAARQISEISGYSTRFTAPFFNEFVLLCPKPADEVLEHLRKRKIIGGLPLSRFFPEMKKELLICVTETISRVEIDALVEALRN
jgi:glycine dehydrogenase subunit 1